MTKLGNVLKDTQYLTRIKNATSAILHPNHPRHHGIKMQAHHAISAEGVKKSGLSKELVQFGYDINLLANLAFIPSTLQGACHLGVQPHRGNHTALFGGEEQETESDNDIALAYHDLVKTRVKELKRDLVGKCPAEDPNARSKIRKKMDDISESILDDIQNAPTVAPLTSVATSFAPNNRVGCGGVDSIPSHRGTDCPVERNHLNQQGSGQRSESISYAKSGRYVLRMGH